MPRRWTYVTCRGAVIAHRPLGALGVTGVQQFPRVSGGYPDDPLGQACSEWTRHFLLVFLLALTHRQYGVLSGHAPVPPGRQL